MDLRDHFNTLARYHLWATERMLTQIALISDADYRQDCGLFFKSVHGTLNHMLVGEQHWYARFADGVSLKLALNAEVEQDKARLLQALRAAVKRWGDWTDTLDAAHFAGDIRYTRSSGELVVTPFAATLGHVFNHGTHHRGQISAVLTALHQPALEMDLIYMLQAEMKS